MICDSCDSDTLVSECRKCGQFLCDVHLGAHACRPERLLQKDAKDLYRMRRAIIKLKRHDVKAGMPPQPSKHIAGLAFSRNPASICIRIASAWLYCLMLRESRDYRDNDPVREFYLASSGFSPKADPEWVKIWMAGMSARGLLPPAAMNKEFKWLCENLFPFLTLFSVLHCFWREFQVIISKLVSALRKVGGNLQAYILIISTDIDHTMAASLKIQGLYVTFRFMDPNSVHGEVVIRLSLSEEMQWSEKIVAVTFKAGLQLDPTTDFTIVTMCNSGSNSLALTNFNELQGIPAEKWAFFLNAFLLHGGGKKGVYLDYVCELLKRVPVEALAYPQPSDGARVLMIAAQNNYCEVVEQILSKVSSLSESLQRSALEAKDDGMTALMLAAAYGHIGVVSTILKAIVQFPYNLQMIVLKARDDGMTALIYAAAYGHIGVVSTILKAIVQFPYNLQMIVLKAGVDGGTALIYAAYNGHIGVVSTILQEIAQLPDNLQILMCGIKSDGTTAFVSAAYNKHFSVLEVIADILPRLSKPAKDLMLQHFGNNSPLDWAKQSGCPPHIIAKIEAVLCER